MSRLKCYSVGFVMVCLKWFTLLSNTLIEQQGVEQRVLSGQAVSCQFNLSYLLFMNSCEFASLRRKKVLVKCTISDQCVATQ